MRKNDYIYVMNEITTIKGKGTTHHNQISNFFISFVSFPHTIIIINKTENKLNLNKTNTKNREEKKTMRRKKKGMKERIGTM